MPVRIAIDAGHGGYDNGATYQGRREKEDNLDIALAVGEILEKNGVEVVYTRVTDVYDSPVRKAQIANEAGADFFVSIHRNSSPNPNTYSGVETLVYDEAGVKAEMAEISRLMFPIAIQNLILENVGTPKLEAAINLNNFVLKLSKFNSTVSPFIVIRSTT